MYAARQGYLTRLAAMLRRRQAPTQQLQIMPDRIELTGQQLAGSYLSVDTIMHQLQECIGCETRTSVKFMQVVGHKARVK